MTSNENTICPAPEEENVFLIIYGYVYPRSPLGSDGEREGDDLVGKRTILGELEVSQGGLPRHDLIVLAAVGY